MTIEKKTTILICGVLPPPIYGHSMLYQMLMSTTFAQHFNISFLNLHFWSYRTNKKVTFLKLIKLMVYLFQHIFLLLTKRPKFTLYNMSFYPTPFIKDWLFCAIAHMFGSKIVIHDHGQYVKELFENTTGIKNKMLKCLLNRSVGSIVLGENIKPFYQGLMDTRKLYIGSGSVIDSQKIQSSQRESNNKTVLFFSHLSKDKGIWQAFDIVKSIMSKRQDIHFTFAGPMANEEVEQSFNELQKLYPNHIKYLGYIDSDQGRTEMFRSVDLYVFPTQREAFGLVLLHALAEGVPVVASKEGCIPEIISDGENGLLANKNAVQEFVSHIETLIDDTSQLQEISKRNRQKYEDNYTPEQYGKRMINIFDQLNQDHV